MKYIEENLNDATIADLLLLMVIKFAETDFTMEMLERRPRLADQIFINLIQSRKIKISFRVPGEKQSKPWSTLLDKITSLNGGRGVVLAPLKCSFAFPPLKDAWYKHSGFHAIYFNLLRILDRHGMTIVHRAGKLVHASSRAARSVARRVGIAWWAPTSRVASAAAQLAWVRA